jgi:hypothetical protein
MTLYFLTSPDGSRVLTNLDTGKLMAWESREEAERAREGYGDRFGALKVEGRIVEDRKGE